MHVADLLVAQAVHLGQDQRGSLALRQLAQTFEHAADLLALLDLVDGAGARRDLAVQLDDRDGAAAGC